MNILAIDTTTKTASVSIKKDNKIFIDKTNNEVTHSEKLLPLIDKVLTSSNTTLKSIQKLACINGPGSFTGIRIGLATIKALSQVQNIDIFSIDSLELIAAITFYKNEFDNIVSIISTNNDRVYYCIYSIEKINSKINIKKITDIKNDYINDAVLNIKEEIKNNNLESVCVTGNCINNFSNELNNLNCKLFDFYPDTNDCINAYSYINDISKYTFNAYTLNATYARPSQAERMKNGTN